jgi:hypothetical protein
MRRQYGRKHSLPYTLTSHFWDSPISSNGLYHPLPVLFVVPSRLKCKNQGTSPVFHGDYSLRIILLEKQGEIRKTLIKYKRFD